MSLALSQDEHQIADCANPSVFSIKSGQWRTPSLRLRVFPTRKLIDFRRSHASCSLSLARQFFFLTADHSWLSNSLCKPTRR